MSAPARRLDPRGDVVRRDGALTRFERGAGGAAGPVAPGPIAAPPAEPASAPLLACVAVVPDAPDARLSARDRQSVAAARQLADEAGLPLLAIVEGAIPGLADAGVDAVVVVPPAGPGGPDARVGRFGAVADAHGARHVVFPDTPAGGDVGRRLAVARGVRPTTGLVALEGGAAVVALPEAGLEGAAAPAPVVLVGPAFALPLKVAPGLARLLPPPELTDVRDVPALEDLGTLSAAAETVPIAEAELILAGGAGVSDWSLFAAAAKALGAAPAASRVVVDAGLMPRDRQVGASGAAVRARAYLAVGISGAVQHLEGITACGTVVSVNRDEACPMAARADLAVVGDAGDVLRALVEEAERGP